jgi:hypothetical protein
MVSDGTALGRRNRTSIGDDMNTRRRFAHGLLISALALLPFPAGGCLMYRANALGTAPIEAPMRVEGDTGLVIRERVTIWSLAYGLARKGRSHIECDGAGLQEVTLTSPPHYTLLTLITLGAVSPKRLQTKCAKTVPAGGVFGPDSAGRQ